MLSIPSPSQTPSDDAPKNDDQEHPPTDTDIPAPATTTSSTPIINRNLKLLYGGLTFFTLSLLITRRATRSRILASIPPYYTSSVYHKPFENVPSATDAVEALSLATLNVLSFSMAVSGGVLYALNINNVEDLRRISMQAFAGGINTPGKGQSDEELEEIEAWVVTVLGKKAEREFQKEKERLQTVSKEGDGQNNGART